MRKVFYSCYELANPVKGFLVKGSSILLFIFLLFFSASVSGQSGDLSQIRNGDGKLHKVQGQDVWDTCGKCWVNGNAGASNAHLREGYSIPYRSLLTGLTAGVCYEYEIGYDTYHSAMAIDFLTHYQRLEPHGPFGHQAEFVQPLVMQSGSVEYVMGTTSTMTFPIPAPAASGIASGAFNIDGVTPKNISAQPVTVFNALPASERVMTIWNGTIQYIYYFSQAPIVLGGADAETKLRIRFQADDDSVLLAWGGHIASRLDWGYSGLDNKGNPIPLSAGGISGSPYHMRQKAMFTVTCSESEAPGANPVVVSGFGNQDRSLAAAAVFPPPECPTVTSQTQCAGNTSFVFGIQTPQAGVSYTWSFGTNTIDARFVGNTTSATGNNVTVVHNGGGAFETAGSFALNITAVLNSVPQECPGVATGTIEKTIVAASANPTTIDITSLAHNTTLTASISAGSSDLNEANYSYSWSIVTAGTTGSLTNATSKVATYTAGVGDAGSTIVFQVVATHNTGAQCVGNATTSVGVNSVGACDVSPQAAICQNTTTTHTGSPDPKPSNATYVWSLTGYGGSGTTTSTLIGGNSGGVSQQVNATQSYRIILTQTYSNTALNTSCHEDVTVIPTPTVTAIYNPPGCTETTFSIDVPSSVVGSTYRVTQGGETTPTYDESKAGTGNTLNFTGLAAGGGFLVRVTTGTASCTATTDCANSSNSCTDAVARSGNTNLSEASIAKPSETYKIVLESPTDVTAVPNPFTDKVRFSMRSAVSGRGSLELYNVMGQKVAVVHEGYFQAGQEFTKDYNVTRGSTATLIYIFKVGDHKTTGKLVSLK